MCYSKEIQLITSLIIFISILAYYLFYHERYKKVGKKWIISFLNMVLFAALAIGFHQFFEFLSLVTNNNIIYKIGLISSISATYFLLCSLERLSNVKLYSKIALVVIALVSFHIIVSPMEFGAGLFYVKHYSAFIWWAAWLFLFFYWNISALRIYRTLNDESSRKTLLLYVLTVADISFILSMIYVFAGYFFFFHR